MTIWKRMDGLTMLSTLAVRNKITIMEEDLLVDLGRIHATK